MREDKVVTLDKSAIRPGERAFLSVRDGAAYLSVSEGLIRRFLERRQLTRFKIGSRTVVSAKELLGLVHPE